MIVKETIEAHRSRGAILGVSLKAVSILHNLVDISGADMIVWYGTWVSILT